MRIRTGRFEEIGSGCLGRAAGKLKKTQEHRLKRVLPDGPREARPFDAWLAGPKSYENLLS